MREHASLVLLLSTRQKQIGRTQKKQQLRNTHASPGYLPVPLPKELRGTGGGWASCVSSAAVVAKGVGGGAPCTGCGCEAVEGPCRFCGDAGAIKGDEGGKTSLLPERRGWPEGRLVTLNEWA